MTDNTQKFNRVTAKISSDLFWIQTTLSVFKLKSSECVTNNVTDHVHQNMPSITRFQINNGFILLRHILTFFARLSNADDNSTLFFQHLHNFHSLFSHNQQWNSYVAPLLRCIKPGHSAENPKVYCEYHKFLKKNERNIKHLWTKDVRVYRFLISVNIHFHVKKCLPFLIPFLLITGSVTK